MEVGNVSVKRCSPERPLQSRYADGKERVHELPVVRQQPECGVRPPQRDVSGSFSATGPLLEEKIGRLPSGREHRSPLDLLGLHHLGKSDERGYTVLEDRMQEGAQGSHAV